MNKGPLRTPAIRFRIVFVTIDGASACLERGGRAFLYPARGPVTIANPYKSASATVFGGGSVSELPTTYPELGD